MRKRFLSLLFTTLVFLIPTVVLAEESLSHISTLPKEYSQTPQLTIDLAVPQLTNTGFEALEQDINNDIQHKVNTMLEETKKDAEDYYQKYTQSASKETEFMPLSFLVTYETKLDNTDYVSFQLTLFKSYLSAQTEKYFYTIDLKTGKLVSLADLIGPKFKEIINPQIKKQIIEREKDENQLFFQDENKFKTISDSQKFYLNKDGEIVVVFDKYSIAPGYMDFPEFTIKTDKARN